MRAKLITFALAAATVVGLGVGVWQTTAQASVDNTPDCDNVAIVYCGTMSESQFHAKFNNDGRYKDHSKVFAAFGINKSDVTGMVDGIVWRDGRVTVGGKTVATGAMTAGRNYGGTLIAGTSNAAKFSTSKFVTEGQTAMVKIVDGTFKFAVLKTCGNPVTATPVAPPKPQTPPTPPPTPPKPQPASACRELRASVISTNRVRLEGWGSATNGARLTSYNFAVTDNAGRTVFAKAVPVDNAPYMTATSDALQPGTYKVTLVIKTSIGDRTGTQCTATLTIPTPPKPVAACEGVTRQVVSRTVSNFTATASVQNGARVNSYVFTVKNASGSVVVTRTVTSAALSAQSGNIELAPGSYSLSVVVKTSVGDKTGANCSLSFTVPKENEVEVCEPSTGKTIRVPESDKDKYPPVGSPECKQIVVCVIATKETKTIRQSEYDASIHTTDFAKCKEVPVAPPVTPDVPVPPATISLPETGPVDTMISLLGVGSLLTAGSVYFATRRER